MHISYTYLHFYHDLHVILKITKAVTCSLYNFHIICYLAAWGLAMSFVEVYTAVVILRVNLAEGISGPIYIVPTMGVMVLLRMRNFLNRSCRENESSITFENYTVNKIMWKHFVDPGRPHKICCMYIACWIPKATNTHPRIVFAFPLQQWLDELTSLLHYTCITCLVDCKLAHLLKILWPYSKRGGCCIKASCEL